MENFGFFDIIILILIGLLGLKGLLRGLVKELFAIFGIIGGIFIASRVASSTGGLIDVVVGFQNENTMLLVGFIISLSIIWTAAYFAGIFLSTMFTLTGLGIFDRILGFLFGAGKVFLLFSVIFYALSSVETVKNKMSKLEQTSFFYPMLVSSGAVIIKLNNESLKNNITTKMDNVSNATKSSINDISNQVVNEKLKNPN